MATISDTTKYILQLYNNVTRKSYHAFHCFLRIFTTPYVPILDEFAQQVHAKLRAYEKELNKRQGLLDNANLEVHSLRDEIKDLKKERDELKIHLKNLETLYNHATFLESMKEKEVLLSEREARLIDRLDRDAQKETHIKYLLQSLQYMKHERDMALSKNDGHYRASGAGSPIDENESEATLSYTNNYVSDKELLGKDEIPIQVVLKLDSVDEKHQVYINRISELEDRLATALKEIASSKSLKSNGLKYNGILSTSDTSRNTVTCEGEITDCFTNSESAIENDTEEFFPPEAQLTTDD